jgi:CubicO group peptidase (beta-lactamase class C family)
VPHYTASLAKALVGGMSLLLALNDGRLRVDDPVCRYVPRWRDHPEKSHITLRHLATHTSGIEDSSLEGVAHTQEPGWKGRFWKREPDPFTISVREVLFDPERAASTATPGMAAWRGQ